MRDLTKIYTEKQLDTLDTLRLSGVGLTIGEEQPLSQEDFLTWLVVRYLDGKRASAVDTKRKKLTEEEIDTVLSARE